MKRLLVVLFFTLPLGAPVTIQRNVIWNEIVIAIQDQETPLLEVQKFLKQNEERFKPEVLDYRVLKNLDKTIDLNDRITKKLKQLRKQLEGGRP